MTAAPQAEETSLDSQQSPDPEQEAIISEQRALLTEGQNLIESLRRAAHDLNTAQERDDALFREKQEALRLYFADQQEPEP